MTRTNTIEITKVFLNTWGAYNNGCIGYGWMDAQEAREFIENDPERDGGEWFIADIDNYLGVDFGNLDYVDVADVLDTIEALEDMGESERDDIVALMEYDGMELDEAIEKKNNYVFYSDIDSFYNCMDELIEMEAGSAGEIFIRYFDWNAYHSDCMFDAYEAKNGVVICEN